MLKPAPANFGKRHEKLQSSPSVCGLGVGFVKHSRGNCGVFREAVFTVRFRPAREPLTTPEIHLVIGRSATAHLNGLKFIWLFVFYRER